MDQRPQKIATLPVGRLLTLLFAGWASSLSAEPVIPDTQPDPLVKLPDGFQAYVVVDSLEARGRHIAIRDNGDVYVSLVRGGGHDYKGGVAALQDHDGDGLYEHIEYFGEGAGTGLHIYEGYLYRSTTQQVLRHKLIDGELIPGAAEIIVTDLPDQNSHAARSLVFDNEGHLYVELGAPSNACMEQRRTRGSPGQRPCPELELQGTTWRFDAMKRGQTIEKDGYRYSTGHRHIIAMEWNQQADELFGVMHGRDQLNQLFPDLYTERESAELPSEEFHILREGSNLGWPYTYWDHIDGVRRIAPEYGGDSVAVDNSGQYQEPIMGFPGHWAPNDLIFYSGDQFPRRYHNGALVVFHGSWNRSPFGQEGYNLVFVPMRNGRITGDYEIFASGFPAVDEIPHAGAARYRPCGVAVMEDGSLLVVDSTQGRMWRIIYTGASDLAAVAP